MGAEYWRVFAALPVDDAVRSLMRDVQDQLRERDWRVKWVDPGLAHLTIRFYGNVVRDEIGALQQRLASAASEGTAARIRTGVVGAFPSSSRPRVIWLGLAGDVDALRDLADNVASATAHVGQPDTKLFKPHITLGRVREGSRPPADFGDAVKTLRNDEVPFSIDWLQLIRSILSPTGPSYTVIDEWPLGRALTPEPVLTPELHEHG